MREWKPHSEMATIEGCTACGWRGAETDLDGTDLDTCPECAAEGTLTTYYGPDELRSWELNDEEMAGEPRDRRPTVAAEPVCITCSDTHRMRLRNEEGDESVVPCTRCPLPCRKCSANGGRGAFCATTPCSCDCHAHETRGRRKRALDTAERIRALASAVAEDLRDGQSLQISAVQGIASEAVALAADLGRGDADDGG